MPDRAYVSAYVPLKTPDLANTSVTLYDVRYTREPELKMYDSTEAELERAELQRLNVHIGEHYCEFVVEPLPGGEYAIFCSTHPPELKLSAVLETAAGS